MCVRVSRRERERERKAMGGMGGLYIYAAGRGRGTASTQSHHRFPIVMSVGPCIASPNYTPLAKPPLPPTPLSDPVYGIRGSEMGGKGSSAIAGANMATAVTVAGRFGRFGR